MIDKKFFKKYQKQLVWFINIWIGRWFFCVDKEIQNIHEVKPNAISYDKCLIRKNGEWRIQQKTCFRTHNKYAKLINHRLRHFQRLGYLIPAFLKPELGLATMLFIPLAVSTFYPDADPESTSVDGPIKHGYYIGLLWADIQGGAGQEAQPSANEGSAVMIDAYTTANYYYQLFRGVVLFDTSDIDNGDDLDNTVLSVYGIGKTNNGGFSPEINIYSSNPASNTNLVSGDYDSLGTTEFATGITYANWSTTGYNDFTLNASGEAAIDFAGVSKLGMRESVYDVPNNEPTWSSDIYMEFRCKYSEQTGTSQDPKLVVTHSAAAIDYEMVAALGTFTLTGVSIGAYFGRIIAALVGTFTLTGIATGLTSARNMIASAGSFVLTGITTGLTSTRSMVASLGTFTLTGIDVLFSRGKAIIVEVGNFALTGIDTTLTSTRSMIASAGSFALTGITTGLTSARKIAIATGSFILTGITTGTSFARTIVASVGIFTLTGVAATFTYGKIMVASVGEFILNGIDVRLKRGWRKRIIKNVTTFTKQEKQTTNFSKQEKRESSWTKQPKP